MDDPQAPPKSQRNAFGRHQQQMHEGHRRTWVCKKKQEEKCTCRLKVDGHCLYKGECETTGIIYKITCKICQDFYIDKTIRSLKERTQEHYQCCGRFLALKKQFLARLDPTFSITSGSITPIQSRTNSRMTRSMTRANGNKKTQPQQLPKPLLG